MHALLDALASCLPVLCCCQWCGRRRLQPSSNPYRRLPRAGSRPKGATLHKLEELTGCRIQIQDRDATDPSSKSVPITITGPAAGLTTAHKSVMELASKGYAMALVGPDFMESVMLIHPVYYSELIGSRGAVINAIKDELGVQLSFPKTPKDVSQAKPGKVTLAGPRAAVMKCKEVVAEIMQHYHSPVTHPGLVHAEFDVSGGFATRFPLQS